MEGRSENDSDAEFFDADAAEEEGDDDGEEEESEDDDTEEEGLEHELTEERASPTAHQPFDTSLPSIHTYLGSVADIVTGSNHFSELISYPDGVSLPLFRLDGVVLFPGGTLPAIFHEAYERAGVLSALGARLPFRNFIAVVMGPSRFDRRPQRSPAVGCIAEIRQIRRDDPSGSINIVATGRCRFRLAASDDADVLEGSSVRVVPLPDAPDIAVPADIRLPSEARAATLQASNASCPGVGSSGGGAGSGGALAGVRRRRGWEESTAGFSGLPGWTWRLFDPYAIAATLREMPAVKAAASREASLVRSPTALAYWAAEHLPLDNGNRQVLLEAPTTLDRLRLLIKLAATVDGVHCRRCGTQIAATSSVVTMSEEGSGGTYVNPHGVVSDLMTLLTVRNCALEGSPSEEFSWFPGYAWTVATCESCFAFLGAPL